METILFILLSIGGAAIVFQLFVVLKAIWYLKITFPKQLRPHFKRKAETFFKEKPPVLVFVPCKGNPEDFESNVEMMLSLDYPHYSLVYITESAEEPAALFLSELALKHPRLYHIVAGKTSRCCQKNHNLLEGINFVNNHNIAGEIYVFADGDMYPQSDWLKNMIMPLADQRVFAVSGFRRLYPKQKRFAEYQHAVFNAFLGMAITDNRYSGMWGGSMAISRQSFEKYCVYQKWATAMVDDTSLTWIIKKHNLVRIFSPDCIVSSNEAYDSCKKVFDWFIRQTQYGANYLRKYAGFGVLINTMTTLVIWTLPVSIFLAFFQTVSWHFAGYHIFYFVLSIVIIRFLMSFNKVSFDCLRWLFYSPCFFLFGVYCGWRGYVSKRMIWANVVYHINRNGEVLLVER